MQIPREGSIQRRVLKVLVDTQTPLTPKAIWETVIQDGGKVLHGYQIEPAIWELKKRGYEIQMDPPLSRHNRSTKGRTFRLLRSERTSPPVEADPRLGLEVVVRFRDANKARQFASYLRTVAEVAEVEIR